jgi:hypothetical protein
MHNRPFALIGVNINCYKPDKLKQVMDKEEIHFRSFTDRAEGEGLGVISNAWNLMGTPTVFLLDHRGVIRYSRRGIPDAKAIEKVLTKLVEEAERGD